MPRLFLFHIWQFSNLQVKRAASISTAGLDEAGGAEDYVPAQESQGGGTQVNEGSDTVSVQEKTTTVLVIAL